MQFPSDIYRAAGITASDIAALAGVSRITGYRWLQGKNRSTGADGVGVNVFLQDRVAKLTASVTNAVAAKALPNPTVMQLTPAQRAKKLRSILNQHRTKK